ncbi:MAG: DUF3179 domain-containing protein, partial [Zavarzinella sp.]|nr:DUF3179 domain-containing protein [Zavarzinella sp.]
MRRTRTGLLLAGVFSLAVVGAVAADEIYQLCSALAKSPDDSNTYQRVGYVGYPSPLITDPPAVPAAAAKLADSEPVIGVTAGGKARAYRRSALEHVHYHVVNDLLGGVPVTVTRCDRKQCTRVFTGDGTRALRLRVGGYADGLLVKAGDRTYRQEDGKPTAGPEAGTVPFRPFAFVEATWAEWRAAHPDTDVVLGVELT